MSSSKAAAAEEARQKQEILDWIQAVIGPEDPIPKEPFEKALKNGVVICKLINKLQPGSVKRIQSKGSNFQLMENHAAFQKGVKKYGVPDDEIFQTVDLFEARNIKQVVKSLYALGRIATNKAGYEGPTLGPKMATENKRGFTEEQGRANRDGAIGLQSGSNKGASQAGLNMGKQRMIQD